MKGRERLRVLYRSRGRQKGGDMTAWSNDQAREEGVGLKEIKVEL